MKYIGILGLPLLLAACGQFAGQEATTPSCFENCSPGTQSQNDNKIVDLNAILSGSVHDSTSTITFDEKTKTITLSLPLTGASYIEANETGYTVEGIKSAILKVVEPESSVTQIDLSLSLAYFLQNHDIAQTELLPNGQKIPTFPDGNYGYVNLDLNGTNVRVYLSKGHLGLYVESPFNPYVQVSYPSINKDDQVLGYLTQIPAIAHSSGAFFSSIALDQEALQNLENQL